ncbi:NAD P-binding protein [Gloeophyllum trabeum ATCC 11539]|uniref:NAD P-binding protein n=1 Tax=Gloeophyllum trabeum (strain ATCC 11539 / FP-39264 / Madison 617) TaxID=670483 RepID=S7QCD4_GLOTA|nr:NAD P-binding protein [Gloeophyllum trabeum ATCC 11539]EPQ57033.1 NAD P-binding protein [Gloeophyllum trabeum ATCC 11539]
MGQVDMLKEILRHRAGAPPLAVKADLSGKTVIVVGANTGIGLEAAKHFVNMNASRVILACRNEEKGRRAVAAVESATGKKTAELWMIDLARFSSVVEFAEKWEKDGGRLDYLVMNAAKATFTYTKEEGWESTLHVNHLSTVLCSLLLLPSLLKTASEHSVQTRLVVVASGVHYWMDLNESIRQSPSILEKLSEEGVLQGQQLYVTSKLLNVLFVRALNARLPPASPLIVTAIDPGYCDSELRHEAEDYPPPSVEHNGERIELVTITSEEGSRQILYGALGPPGAVEDPSAVDKIKGGYVSWNEIVEPSDFVLSDAGKESGDRIWDETVQVLNKVTPKVGKIVERYLKA